MSERRRILVVEDGREYVEAFASLAAKLPGVALELVRAGDLVEAVERLGEASVDGVFLDVVFDRTPPERLTGDLPLLIGRFGGDRARAVRHLAESQGFYLLDALLPALPAGIPIVLAHDFADEPQRFEALKRRAPGLAGLPDGASASEALRLLISRD